MEKMYCNISIDILVVNGINICSRFILLFLFIMLYFQQVKKGSNMYSIDLNSDMGESFGAYKLGGDEEIIKYVTTANVACGWHAGDPMVMDKVVRMAKERGVMVGAHPGYPDLLGFGRRKMVLSHDEVKNYVRYQIGALAAFTKSYGMKLQHVAPHGAMGNGCQYDEDISTAICEAICEYDKDLIVYYCAGAVLGDIAESKGLRTASEIFADRAYMDDLSLVNC